MPAETSTRWGTALLVLIAAGAWVLRASVFFRVDGVLGWPVDYDEGVYVAASALTWRGVLPYRDFVFVHPPGVPLLLGLFTAWPLPPSQMLAGIRIAMTLVGALNVLLLGLLVRRHAGIVGAVIAAVLYASYPEAVYAERGAFLEPLLNLACLAFVASWTADRPRLRLAALAGGWMLIIKSWGVLWLVGAIAGARSRSDALRLLGLSAAVAAVVLLPFLFLGGLIDQALLFHLGRPPDGTPDRWPRLLVMFFESNRVTAAVTLAGLLGLLVHRQRPIARMAALVLGLVIAAFLASSAWWSQYDAHLALAQALVAGIGCGLLWERTQLRSVYAVAVALLLAIPGTRAVIGRRHDRDPAQSIRAAAVREAPPAPTACAFEAFDLLLGDRLPSGPVDPYGQMLLDATRDGARYPSATEAFQSEASQRTLRTQLAGCGLVVVGWRGDWQMNVRTRSEFDGNFSLVRDSVFLRK
ncbi:MAG: hypothetical protein H6Q89_4978 [Myxococcaceae bacterium]|nr:hypothetical protein [Myxococcaceae bacterium]